LLFVVSREVCLRISSSNTLDDSVSHPVRLRFVVQRNRAQGRQPVLQVGSSLVPVRRSLRHNLEIKREGRESIVSAISVIIYIPKQICVKEGKLRTRPDSCAASIPVCRSLVYGSIE
jgi:hypothetical protein